MKFFRVPFGQVISNCCLDDYLERKTSDREDGIVTTLKQKQIKKTIFPNKEKERRNEPFLARVRQTLDNPNYSLYALVLHIFITVTIFVNVFANIAETCPCNHDLNCGAAFPRMFFAIDSFCVAVFTLEYFMGVISSLSPWRHIRASSNMIDLMAIVPFYLNLVVEHTTNSASGELGSLSVLRVFRIVKLARYSDKLTELVKSIKNSSKELSLIVFIYSLTVVLFSSIAYYVEKDVEDTNFSSIAAAMWYTIVTTTTLGYGDMVPLTVVGKILGGMCCLMGALVVSLPVPVTLLKGQRLKRSK
ncbi:potassium voltage-gated channel protein Shal-like [Nematostella vectensis]|uniref:potassium voltage-gated channel protein Shal-like n=1 Tax=Nematostella vectensis TaxID=45351 RepID=UPI00138FF467|nr:potassium voltage-gated channel protein Shal-like [Nematostella vectensis]